MTTKAELIRNIMKEVNKSYNDQYIWPIFIISKSDLEKILINNIPEVESEIRQCMICKKHYKEWLLKFCSAECCKDWNWIY